MLGENLALLGQLYVRPRRALSQIMDEGSVLFGLLAVLLVSLLSSLGTIAPMYAALSSRTVPVAPAPARPGGAAPSSWVATPEAPPDLTSRMMGSFVTTSVLGVLFGLAALYVPACILAATFLAQVGSFGVAFRRDYGSLLVCALFSWTASHLPYALLSTALAALGTSPLGAMVGAWLVCLGAFGLLMVLSLRIVLGMEVAAATAAAGLGVFGLFLLPFGSIVASPFLLYWGWRYFRGDVSDIQWSFSRRQSFKRHLQAATVNPRDAEAHYQLGLIYQQRRQAPEAIERFRKAVEIDPQEVDAHYQLGRLARTEKRFTEAIAHFEEVVRRAPTHSRHEVWREIGATYAGSEDTEHARWALEKFVAERPHDPEGLCRLGEALRNGGAEPAAREHFQRALEAADTMPVYRRREVSEWRRWAKRRLRP